MIEGRGIELCWFAGGSYSADFLRRLKGYVGFRMKRLQTSIDSYLYKLLNIHIQIPAVLKKEETKTPSSTDVSLKTDDSHFWIHG